MPRSSHRICRRQISRRCWGGHCSCPGRKSSPPVMSSLPLLLLLLVLVVHWGGGEAAPTPQKFKVRGRGRADPGETATLSCGFLWSSTTSPSSYEWTRDGEVIPGETSSTLTLSPVTTRDAGIYKCGDPDSDLERLEHDLYVTGARLPQPVIRWKRVDVLGRSFAMECVIMTIYIPNDKTVYTWYKDGTEIEGQSSPVLQFPRVREADVGRYTCTAREGPEETTSPHASYYHLLPLVTPEVHIEPTSPDNVIKGILGENLTLTCNVTRAFPGVPADGYSWSYLPSPQGPRRPLVGKASTMTLGPLTREDGGQYFCQARNDQDLQQYNVNLAGNASVTVHIIYLDNINLTSDLEVKEGDPLTLTCSVVSHPAARLAWSVHGQEVRHVTDNLDHYVILSAGCSDSTSYTCRASNPDMPGREMSASTRLQVLCDTVPLISNDTTAEISASFDFWLPNKTSMVVVHPRGQDMLTVQQDCSFNISSAFLPRLLHPRCDPAQRHLSFTLTKVTEEDEGNYTVMEEGERRKIPGLEKELRLTRIVQYEPPSEQSHNLTVGFVTALVFVLVYLGITLGIVLGVKYRHHTLKLSTRVRTFFTTSCNSRNTTISNQEDSLSFKTLYKDGQVYISPALSPPPDEVQINENEENESGAATPLLKQSPTDAGAEFTVKDLVRSTLQESTKTSHPPSFLLHNTRLSRQENILLVLSRKLGVLVMAVKAVKHVEELQPEDEAVRQLLEARKKVEERLADLVKPGAVTAVLALPNLPGSKMQSVWQRLKILRSHPDVEVLLGKTRDANQQMAEQLTSRPDSDVWNFSNPGADSPGADSPGADSPGTDSADTVYMKAASRFLTLTGCSPQGKSPRQPAAAEEGWLLTPAQLQVRDSTARLLHIWGPPGSGKTSLLIQKAREWVEEGKGVVLAVGRELFDIKLAHILEAMVSGQDEEARHRIRVCCTYQEIDRAVKELRGPPPHKDTCIMIDDLQETERFHDMLLHDEFKTSLNICSTSRQDLPTLDPKLRKKFHQLGWENVRLPDCIRCTKSTVQLLNLLMRGSPDYTPIPACSLPRAQGIPPWRVVDHSLHPQHTSTTSGCPQCREEMSAAVPSPEDGLDWRDWIALYTGKLHVNFDRNSLCKVLKDVGVPATFDSGSYIRGEADSPSSSAAKDFTRFHKRVHAGVDEEGRPAVHLLQCTDFRGMERQGVLLVHWDQRDEDPARQSQEARETRLTEHRRQWINAVSRSRGQVILLLLSPSPARTLLGLP